MKRFFTAILMLLLGRAALLAVPAFPLRKTVKLADGSSVELTLRGDEHFSYFSANDGRNFRRISTGEFQLIPTKEFIRQQQEAESRRMAMNNRRLTRMKNRSQSRSQNLLTGSGNWLTGSDNRKAAPTRSVMGELKGTKKGLVILVNFADNAFTIPEPQQFYQRYFNEEGFSENGFMGSVGDYFREQSYGQFNLDFDVVGPYTLPKAMFWYGAPEGAGYDRNPAAMAWEAMQLANEDVDYRNYDWDGDEEVDQVFIVYAGYGENYGADPKTIWPHEYFVDDQTHGERLDGMRLSTYGCSCELQGTEGTIPDGIGAPCHEFTHCLGYPDFYNTDGATGYAMNTWDIMSTGTYNGTKELQGICPAAFTSYERWMAGWLEPKELTEETIVRDMKPLTQSPEAYVIYNDANRDEYYLLENRQLDGFDRLGYGHGMLVIHVDFDQTAWEKNTVNTNPQHQRMNIIAADNSYVATSAKNIGGDPFPGTSRVTALTDETTPAATLFNPNLDGRCFMGKPIEGIKESPEGLISFSFCRTTLDVPEVALESTDADSFCISWQAIDGADSYEIQLNEYPPKSKPEEACILKETFAQTLSEEIGTNDISGSMQKYSDTKAKFSGSHLYQSPDYLLIGTASAKGELISPVLSAPSSETLTVVIGVKPFNAGSEVRGTFSFFTNSNGKLSQSFAFSTAGNLIFYPTTTVDEMFRLTFSPATSMYVSSFAIYDGHYSEKELGVSALNGAKETRSALNETKETQSGAEEKLSIRNAGKQRIVTRTVQTTETAYTFTDLLPGYSYEVCVRALESENNRSSNWSEPISVQMPTAIQGLKAAEVLPNKHGIFDLQGRPLSTEPRAGLYIKDGRKFVK